VFCPTCWRRHGHGSRARTRVARMSVDRAQLPPRIGLSPVSAQGQIEDPVRRDKSLACPGASMPMRRPPRRGRIFCDRNIRAVAVGTQLVCASLVVRIFRRRAGRRSGLDAVRRKYCRRSDRCGCCYANNKFEHGILHPASENVAVWTWATPYSTRLSPPCRPDTMLIPVEKERNHQSLI
jgi:hypothetical protein